MSYVSQGFEQVASSLIAMAGSLVGAQSKVRAYMQWSETDFLDYCAARKAPPQPDFERLVELVVREQGNIIAKNRALQAEIRATLKKLQEGL